MSNENQIGWTNTISSWDFLFRSLPWAIVFHWEWHPRTLGIPPFLSKLSFLIWFPSLTQLILVKIASCLNNRATHHPLCDQTGAGEKCLQLGDGGGGVNTDTAGCGVNADWCLSVCLHTFEIDWSYSRHRCCQVEFNLQTLSQLTMLHMEMSKGFLYVGGCYSST